MPPHTHTNPHTHISTHTFSPFRPLFPPCLPPLSLPPSRDEDDDALQMNESDIFKAMNQLQHDDSMPQETRDLINQVGR